MTVAATAVDVPFLLHRSAIVRRHSSTWSVDEDHHHHSRRPPRASPEPSIVDPMASPRWPQLHQQHGQQAGSATAAWEDAALSSSSAESFARHHQQQRTAPSFAANVLNTETMSSGAAAAGTENAAGYRCDGGPLVESRRTPKWRRQTISVSGGRGCRGVHHVTDDDERRRHSSTNATSLFCFFFHRTTNRACGV